MMGLHISALVFVVYAIASLVLPMKMKWWAKVLWSLIIIASGAKYLIYLQTGGILEPKLEPPMVVLLEALYSALMLAVVMALIKDVVLLIRTIFRFFVRRAYNEKMLSGPKRERAPLVFEKWPLGKVTIVIAICAMSAASYGTLSQFKVPEVKVVDIEIKDLPQEFEGYKVVQLTDIHIGPILKGEFLEGVVARTNSLKPDLVLITGDFVDGSVKKLKGEFESFTKLRSKNGVLAVTGNHEYYSGANSWVKTFEEFGIKFLRNESVLIKKSHSSILVAGVPDYRGESMGEVKPDLNKAYSTIINYHEGANTVIAAPSDKQAKALTKRGGADALVNVDKSAAKNFSISAKPSSAGNHNSVNEASAVILMAHQPRVVKEGDLKADLVLVGHTHGGTMFFLKPLIAAFNEGYVSGLYELSERTKLYVSNGTAIWSGFSCRVFVPAEITLFVLHSA